MCPANLELLDCVVYSTSTDGRVYGIQVSETSYALHRLKFDASTKTGLDRYVPTMLQHHGTLALA